MRLNLRRLALAAILVPLACTVRAQDTGLPPVTRSVAVTGATVVPSPGTVIRNATVVIRDGVITAVGAGVDVPFDARVINGDSLWVYAGFVDVLSDVGIEMPDPPEDLPPLESRAEPPDERAGIQPQRRAERFLDAESESITDLRSAGFTAAQVVPGGRMLPGKGALILLRGERAAEMVLRTETGLMLTFRGASGMYPSTPMGIMAKMRQLYREADRRRGLANRYDQNPAGLTPPPFDPTHEALYPVTTGDLRVIGWADTALEARRLLSLRDQLGFELLLVGLDEGFDMLDAFENAEAPIALSLALPDSAEWLRGIRTDSLRAIIDNYDPETRTASFRDVEAEVRNLEAKQAQSLELFGSNAATLAEAGVAFGFSTRGVDAADVLKNVRAMVRAGLDRDVALSALTIEGARALGAEAIMGSVAVGKLGNLVLTDGPLLDSDTEIRHVVVAGDAFIIEEEPSSDKGALKKVVGRWLLTAETPDGPISGEVNLRSAGDRLRGSVTYDGVSAILPIRRGSIEGKILRINFVGPDGEVNVEVTVSGDTFEGTADVAGSPIPVTGSKIP